MEPKASDSKAMPHSHKHQIGHHGEYCNCDREAKMTKEATRKGDQRLWETGSEKLRELLKIRQSINGYAGTPSP